MNHVIVCQRNYVYILIRIQNHSDHFNKVSVFRHQRSTMNMFALFFMKSTIVKVIIHSEESFIYQASDLKLNVNYCIADN